MKVEVEDLSSVEKKVMVEIPAERVKDEFALAYQEVQKQARIKGFRPGKAPMRLVEQQFKDYVREKVLRKLLEDTIDLALERKQLKPIIEPILDFGELKPDSAFSYTLNVEVKPKVEFLQYLGLELEREMFEVTDEMVDKALKELQEKNAIFQEPKEPRPAQTGDLLNLDITAEYNGKVFPPLSGQGFQYILGKESVIPGFEDHLSGLTLGEKRTFHVKFPEDHPYEELKGKEVVYTVELKGLKEKILPEINDEFAKEVAGAKDIADLREKTRERFEQYFQRLARSRLERNLLDKLVELNPVEAPKRLVQKRALELARRFCQQMQIDNPTKEDLEELSKDILPRVEKDIKAGFLLEAIIEKDGIKLDPDKESAKLKELSERYRIDVSKLEDQLGKESLEVLKSQWLEEQALDFLISQSKIKDKKVRPEDEEIKEEKE